jgi:hypothetical protein
MKKVLFALCLLSLSLSLVHASEVNRIGFIEIKDRGDNGCFPIGFCRDDNTGILESMVLKIGGSTTANKFGIKKSLFGNRYTVPVITNSQICKEAKFANENDELTLYLAPSLSKAIVEAGGIRSSTGGLAVVADKETPLGFIQVSIFTVTDIIGLCN